MKQKYMLKNILKTIAEIQKHLLFIQLREKILFYG